MKPEVRYWVWGAAGLLAASIVVAVVWAQTHAVLLTVDNRGSSVLTNVVVIVTGKTYAAGDVAPHSRRRVTVWPAPDGKMQLRHYYRGMDIEHVDLGLPSLFDSSSTVVHTDTFWIELTWHRIFHGSLF
jgi:hypothetical protein